jgi:hypothetical protein
MRIIAGVELTIKLVAPEKAGERRANIVTPYPKPGDLDVFALVKQRAAF